MKKVIHDLVVIENKPAGGNNFVLVLKPNEKLPLMSPGQFCEVKVNKVPEVYLRRPFSIHNVDYEANTLSLLIKAVGKGTTVLSGLSIGEAVNLVYPLGNGFSLKKEAPSGSGPLVFTPSLITLWSIAYCQLRSHSRLRIIARSKPEPGEFINRP